MKKVELTEIQENIIRDYLSVIYHTQPKNWEDVKVKCNQDGKHYIVYLKGNNYVPYIPKTTSVYTKKETGEVDTRTVNSLLRKKVILKSKDGLIFNREYMCKQYLPKSFKGEGDIDIYNKYYYNYFKYPLKSKLSNKNTLDIGGDKVIKLFSIAKIPNYYLNELKVSDLELIKGEYDYKKANANILMGFIYDNTELLGGIILDIDDGNHATIDMIEISEDNRSMGYGELVIDELIKQLKLKNINGQILNDYYTFKFWERIAVKYGQDIVIDEDYEHYLNEDDYDFEYYFDIQI